MRSLTLIIAFLVASAVHALPVYEHTLPFVPSADPAQQGFVHTATPSAEVQPPKGKIRRPPSGAP